MREKQFVLNKQVDDDVMLCTEMAWFDFCKRVHCESN